MSSKKKKILLFMTEFYGYHNDIITEMKRQECDVTWYKDSVELNAFERIVSKTYDKLKNRKYMNSFKSIMEKEKDNHFDEILIIFGAIFMSGEHIELLRKTFLETKIVYYSWDSVKTFPNIKSLFEHADVAYSFDKTDCIRYNVNFLPLFYVVRDTSDNSYLYEWDVSTVMSFYNKKSSNLLKVLEVLPDTTSKYLYIRLRDKSYSLYLNIINHKIYIKLKEHFRFDSLSREECINFFRKSKAVIDCPLLNQNGLTMRTFETLALNRKLITTNQNVKEYDFYCPDNIYVVENEKKIIPNEFFNTPFNRNFEIKDTYGLTHFVETLIK